MVMTVNMLI